MAQEAILLGHYLSPEALRKTIINAFGDTPYAMPNISIETLQSLQFKPEYKDPQSPLIAEFIPEGNKFANCNNIVIRIFPPGTHGFFRLGKQIEAAKNLVSAAKAIGERKKKDQGFNEKINQYLKEYESNLEKLWVRYSEISPEAFIKNGEFDVNNDQLGKCKEFAQEAIPILTDFTEKLILVCYEDDSEKEATAEKKQQWHKEFKAELASTLAKTAQKTHVNVFDISEDKEGRKTAFVDLQIPSGILSDRQLYRLLIYNLQFLPEIKGIMRESDDWFTKAAYLYKFFLDKCQNDENNEKKPKLKLISKCLDDILLLGRIKKKFTDNAVIDYSGCEGKDPEKILYNQLNNEHNFSKINKQDATKIIDKKIEFLETKYYQDCYGLTKLIVKDPLKDPLIIDGIPLQLVNLNKTDSSEENEGLVCYLPTSKRVTPFPLGTANHRTEELHEITGNKTGNKAQLLGRVERGSSNLAIGVDNTKSYSSERLLIALETAEAEIKYLKPNGQLHNTYFSDFGKKSSEFFRMLLGGAKKRTESEYLQLWETIFSTHMCDVGRNEAERKSHPLILINTGFNSQESRKRSKLANFLGWMAPSSQQAYNLFGLISFVITHQDKIGITIDQQDLSQFALIQKKLDEVALKVRQDLLLVDKLGDQELIKKSEKQIQQYQSDYKDILKTHSNDLLSVLHSIGNKLPDEDKNEQSNENLKKLVNYFYFNENLPDGGFEKLIDVPVCIHQVAQQYGIKYKGNCKSITDRTGAAIEEMFSWAIAKSKNLIKDSLQECRKVFASVCSGAQVSMANTNNLALQIGGYTQWPLLAKCHKALSTISVASLKKAASPGSKSPPPSPLKTEPEQKESSSDIGLFLNKSKHENDHNEDEDEGDEDELDQEDENDLWITNEADLVARSVENPAEKKELSRFISTVTKYDLKADAYATNTYPWFEWVKSGCSAEQKFTSKVDNLKRALVDIVKAPILSKSALPVLLNAIEISIRTKKNISLMFNSFREMLISLQNASTSNLVIKKICFMLGHYLASQKNGDELLNIYLNSMFPVKEKNEPSFFSRFFASNQKHLKAQEEIKADVIEMLFEVFSCPKEGQVKISQEILHVLQNHRRKAFGKDNFSSEDELKSQKLKRYPSASANSWYEQVVSNGAATPKEIEDALIGTLLRVNSSRSLKRASVESEIIADDRITVDAMITIFEAERKNGVIKEPQTFKLILYLYYEKFIEENDTDEKIKISKCLNKIIEFMPGILKSDTKTYYLADDFFLLCEECLKFSHELKKSFNEKCFLTTLAEKITSLFGFPGNIFDKFLNERDDSKKYNELCELVFREGHFDEKLYQAINQFLKFKEKNPRSSIKEIDSPAVLMTKQLCQEFFSRLEAIKSSAPNQRQNSWYGVNLFRIEPPEPPEVKLFNSLPNPVIDQFEEHIKNNPAHDKLYWSGLAKFYSSKINPFNSFNQMLSVLFSDDEKSGLDPKNLFHIDKKLTDFSEVKNLSEARINKLITVLCSDKWCKYLDFNLEKSINLRKLRYVLCKTATDKGWPLDPEVTVIFKSEKDTIELSETDGQLSNYAH